MLDSIGEPVICNRNGREYPWKLVPGGKKFVPVQSPYYDLHVEIQ